MQSKRSRTIYLGLGAGILGAVVCLLPWVLDLEEEFGLRWLFGLRGPLGAPGNVAVVAIAGESADVYGLSSDLDEWPRDLHAVLVERLMEAGVAGIVMDIIFEVPGDAAHDARLADAIARSGRVVLLERVRSEELPGNAVAERRIQPIEILKARAAATAPFALPTVPFRVAQFWAFGRGASDIPNLPLVALQLYALPVYDEFIALLAAEAAADVSDLPATLADLGPPIGLETLIRRVRRAFLRDAGLGARIAGRIEIERRESAEAGMLRALTVAYAGGDSRYLNFYGPTGTIETIPYHAILAADGETLDALDLQGRIVFVGFSERRQAEQQDEFISVYSQRSGLNLSGVEIGATAFANLADVSSVKPLPIWGNLALAAVWGALLAFGLSALRSSHAVAAAAVAAALYLCAALYLFASLYVWVPLVAPLGIVLPAVLASTIYVNYRELGLQRERIQTALGRYVPPEVALRLAQESFDAGASRELVHGTCLVSDAEQFTQLAESMDPESLHTLIQAYFAELTSAVEDHGGFVADISGDSMVAIWAGSRPDATLRRSACDAALAALDRIDRFNAVRGRQSLPTGIGLDSGELLLGNIGFAQRFQYRAVGDIVNTASRIQGLNRQLGTRALASAATLESVAGLQTRPLGEFLLLGKANAVLVHELLGAGTHDTGGGELAESFAAALQLFRERDWDRARKAFRQILARHPADGPARFYLHQCELFEDAALPEDWSGTIRMSVK